MTSQQHKGSIKSAPQTFADRKTHHMPGPHNPALQIEKHILENPCTSDWLRSTFQLAIRRDPVDALDDAELLASALRARTLGALSEGAPFNPLITSALLIQHANALSELSRTALSPSSPNANFRFKWDISMFVVKLHQIARELHSSDTNAQPTPTTDGVPAPGSLAGQLI